MLVAAEREMGVVDLPGTEPPPPADAVAAAPEGAPARPEPVPRVAPRAATAPTPVPARPAILPARPRAAEPEPSVRVRPLELPADALAPFGSLPDEVAACRRCGLCETRSRTVFGEGSPTARLVFCGEAPGLDEDRSGRPFVGASGELLTAMIEKGLKMRREDVFILNAIKCRPPENRTPVPEEILACRPYLERQLATIRPQVIVALGNPACRALLGNVPGVMTIRGRRFQGFGATIVPMFHPAYLLRNPDAKREAWEDLRLVMRLLAGERGPT